MLCLKNVILVTIVLNGKTLWQSYFYELLAKKIFYLEIVTTSETF